MLDRESTFANDDIIALLKTKFVPVAIDVFYHERRKDAEGDFYRKVVKQRRGLRPDRTTQGFYIFTPHGSLIVGWNNRDPGKVLRHLRNALKKKHDLRADAVELVEDKRYAHTPPEGGLVVDVYAKVLHATLKAKETRWNRIQRTSIGRDHLWITKTEVAALCRGEWPTSLTNRIMRFHLIDNTRGEPPMWQASEVATERWSFEPQKGFKRVTGVARASADDNKRGYRLGLTGRVVTSKNTVTRFDLVALGGFWGGGRWSSDDLPEGEFTFAVAFRIAADDEAAKVPPQASRDLRGYLRTK